MQQSSNSLELASSQQNALALPIKSMSDLVELGKFVATSGMFGSDINPATGLMVAMTMYQEKMSPLTFKRTYHIIDGEISKKAKVSLGEYQRAGGEYTILKYSRDEVVIRFKYKSNDLTFGMTIKDATETGLTVSKSGKLKENWRKFPDSMLFARVASKGVGVLCPDIVSGIYTQEEVSDFKDVETPIEPTEDEGYGACVIDVVPEEDTDPTVCNIEGKFKNQKWELLDTSLLTYAISMEDSVVTKKAKAYIASILEARDEPTTIQEKGQEND